MSDSLQCLGLSLTWLLCPWDSSGKNTGVGCHTLLQRLFPTQGSNLPHLRLLHCRQILSPLSHLGSPHSFLENRRPGIVTSHSSQTDPYAPSSLHILTPSLRKDIWQKSNQKQIIGLSEMVQVRWRNQDFNHMILY